jgi:hypothetical protein
VGRQDSRRPTLATHYFIAGIAGFFHHNAF